MNLDALTSEELARLIDADNAEAMAYVGRNFPRLIHDADHVSFAESCAESYDEGWTDGFARARSMALDAIPDDSPVKAAVRRAVFPDKADEDEPPDLEAKPKPDPEE